MKKSQIAFIIISIVLAIGFTFFGALAKLEHWPYSNYFLIIGMMIQVGLIGFAIYLGVTNYHKRKHLPKGN